jgi:hypothetical protein
LLGETRQVDREVSRNGFEYPALLEQKDRHPTLWDIKYQRKTAMMTQFRRASALTGCNTRATAGCYFIHSAVVCGLEVEADRAA